MKIVTTGQRGSVATEDEIREVRNNKRRLFSYSLILLFSICALGGVQGAKLCVVSPAPNYVQPALPDSFYCRNNNPVNLPFRLGIGCLYPSNTAWDVLLDNQNDGSCSVLIAIGEGSCDGGLACKCRLIYPFATEWVYSGTTYSAGKEETCKRQCGCYCTYNYVRKGYALPGLNI